MAYKVCFKKYLAMSKYIETKLQKQNNSAYPYVFIIVFFGYFSTGGPSSKYEHPRASALFHNIRYIEDITQWREETNFIFEWQNNILRTSAAS